MAFACRIIMYLLYVDGSGHTRIKHNRQDNGLYVLSGIIIHEDDWKEVDKAVASVKKQLFPDLDPGDLELHAHDIWNSRGFFADEKLILNLEKKLEIFTEVSNLICRSKVTLINVVVVKDLMKDLYDAPSPTEYSWTLIMERFEHFLKYKPGGANNGLILMDSSQKDPESEIRDIVSRLVRQGGPMQRADHVLEDMIFVQSHLRNPIQLADMAAYVVHKYYKGDPMFKDLFEKIMLKMYRPMGMSEGYGIKVFPKI